MASGYALTRIEAGLISHMKQKSIRAPPMIRMVVGCSQPSRQQEYERTVMRMQNCWRAKKQTLVRRFLSDDNADHGRSTCVLGFRFV